MVFSFFFNKCKIAKNFAKIKEKSAERIKKVQSVVLPFDDQTDQGAKIIQSTASKGSQDSAPPGLVFWLRLYAMSSLLVVKTELLRSPRARLAIANHFHLHVIQTEQGMEGIAELENLGFFKPASVKLILEKMMTGAAQ